MNQTIVPTEIPGGAVYGVKQYDYTVDGARGKDYAVALASAAFKESVAIEQFASSFAEVVRQRERKVSDLGEILACLAQAVARLPVKDQSQNDAVSINNAAWVNGTALGYGITLVFNYNTDQMTRGNLQRGQNDVQYALDVENNNLQQDSVTLQGLVSKRDNAFSTASKIISKCQKADKSTISNIQ